MSPIPPDYTFKIRYVDPIPKNEQNNPNDPDRGVLGYTRELQTFWWQSAILGDVTLTPTWIERPPTWVIYHEWGRKFFDMPQGNTGDKSRRDVERWDDLILRLGQGYDEVTKMAK
jgi:hypothetical protein